MTKFKEGMKVLTILTLAFCFGWTANGYYIYQGMFQQSAEVVSGLMPKVGE